MDLSNIELNRPYKPREICTLLNRSMPDSTYQRRKLYEDLSTLFVWHKQGYSIVVDEIISDTPANVRKATIEKKLPFTACIDMISNTLPKEFSDEDLFRAIFNSTFEELTDVSSYTDYDSKTLYNFMWCLRNKIYSKYHTALVQINKRQRLGIGFLNTITGEIGYNSEYSQTWQTIVYDKYDYSSYMKAVTSLCGSIPIYRYKDTDGGVVSHDVYMNIYKHLYDYIYKSFVTTASNESKAKKLVRLWGKDKFKLTFDAPKTNRPKKERKAQDTISTRLKFTDCMRYRIDKYLRENNKSSLTYDDICKALFGDTISDLIKFDYKYTKHAYKRINPETREVTEYKTHGNLKLNVQHRLSYSVLGVICLNLNIFKRREEVTCQLFVFDNGAKRLANFQEVETIMCRNRVLSDTKNMREYMDNIKADLKMLNVSYAPKEFMFSFKKVKDLSDCEQDVQKKLNEYLLNRVKHNMSKKITLGSCFPLTNEMIDAWSSQRLDSLVG